MSSVTPRWCRRSSEMRGSSQSSRAGSAAMACPTRVRCCSPPESSATGASAKAVAPTSSRRAVDALRSAFDARPDAPAVPGHALRDHVAGAQRACPTPSGAAAGCSRSAGGRAAPAARGTTSCRSSAAAARGPCAAARSCRRRSARAPRGTPPARRRGRGRSRASAVAVRQARRRGARARRSRRPVATVVVGGRVGRRAAAGRHFSSAALHRVDVRLLPRDVILPLRERLRDTDDRDAGRGRRPSRPVRSRGWRSARCRRAASTCRR